MKLKLEFGTSCCYTPVFEINGIKADSSDFGDQRDTEPEVAEDYACGNMQFIPSPPNNGVLEKYSINEDEYQEICEKLEKGLSFGSCGWCV